MKKIFTKTLPNIPNSMIVFTHRKKVMLTTLLLVSLFNSFFVNAQIELALAGANTTNQGPSVTDQTATFQRNSTGTTFVTYTPTTTITANLSNFNAAYNLPTSRVSTGRAINFGATGSTASPNATALPFYRPMNAIGTPANTSYTGGTTRAPGTGIDVANNYSFEVSATVVPLAAANAPLGDSFFYARLTFTFNRPVVNPIIHVIGLGGSYGTGTAKHGHSAELILNAGASTSGISLRQLSGATGFRVVNNSILNTSPDFDANCGAGAACGSAEVRGINITTVAFDVYVKGDGLGNAWTVASTAFTGDVFQVGFSFDQPVVAGNVFNDANGLLGTPANTVNGTSINAPGGTQLYVNLLNAAGTAVVDTAIVRDDGTYVLNPGPTAGTFIVQLSTVKGTVGAAPPATSLPAGWVNTGENIGTAAGSDVTVDGRLTVIVAASTDVTNANFGIERKPLALSSTTATQSNFDPYTQPVAPASFGGSDFDGGTVQSISITGFPTNAQTIVVNGTTYTSTTFPVGGILLVAPSGNILPNNVAVKPLYGVARVEIPYVTIDNANVVSVGATVTIPYFTILPVTGLQLTGIRNGNDVVLKWTTLTEQNTSHFIIERSTNGRDFQTVGTATASGNSNALKSYTTIDRYILKDVVYYRVNLVDADGKKTVSNTVTVRLSGFSVSNRVFPDPVRDVINVELARAGRYTITLYNMAGQQISVRQVETGGSIITTINRNNLPAGSYVLKVLNATAKESESFKLILE